MTGDPLSGAEKELQEHRGLSGHSNPLGYGWPESPRRARKIVLDAVSERTR